MSACWWKRTLAADMFRRAPPFLPADNEVILVGFNVRSRILRYRPGGPSRISVMGRISGCRVGGRSETQVATKA